MALSKFKCKEDVAMEKDLRGVLECEDFKNEDRDDVVEYRRMNGRTLAPSTMLGQVLNDVLRKWLAGEARPLKDR